MTEQKQFAEPVHIRVGAKTVSVGSAREAFDILSNPAWPERGPRHAEAVEAALKVLDGHRSTVDAYDALIRAADEAGNLGAN